MFQFFNKLTFKYKVIFSTLPSLLLYILSFWLTKEGHLVSGFVIGIISLLSCSLPTLIIVDSIGKSWNKRN
ncbi:MAG: hypothetical protein PHS49_00330 [Candidatus Gracilibacteria bacterium]|nr:hypothetical protein [Candidatus Gracilibacteria bacterium]